MPQLFVNNAYSALAGSIAIGATSLTVATGTGSRFPSPTGGDFFLLTLANTAGGPESSWEIVKVTARSGDVMTIVRAQEGTTAVAWASGTPVDLRITAGAFNNKTDVGHTHVKADVGLSNVDNTSDASKPISTATQTALNLKADLASPTFTGTVSGITKAMVGLGNVDNTSDASKPVSTATQTALNLKANLASPTFTGTVGGITAAMVGLGNVDNTSDTNKPVSTATQAALNLKVDTSSKGAANGVASLDAGGKVPTTQLPDSVLGQMEYQGTWNASTNTPTIPAAATANKGYYYKVSVAGATNVSGITDWQIGDWIVSNGASWDKIDNTDAVSSVAGRTGAITLTSSDVGLGNVNNTSDANKPISTATQSALDLKAPLASPTFTGTVSGITKSMVGLGNIDNTTDLNKPISTATQSALDLKAPLASPTFTGTVGGITKAMVGLGSVDNTSDLGKPISTATQSALDLKAPLASPTFTGTVSGITAAMVGLGNVDNTSDANKPVSTATQTALNGKQDLNANLTAFAAKTAPTGAVVGTTDTQTLSAKTITGLKETKVNMDTAANIDLALGNYFTKPTFVGGSTTFTVSNVPAAGSAGSFILETTNAGATTITWPTGTKWAGGTAPTLTSAGVDILGFYTHDGGTTWRGLVLAKDSK